LIGGAADLTASTKTIFKDSGNMHIDPAGRNIFFGVREFGMCAAVNGMAVHGGVIPFGSTFFVFTDYCRPALRLSAIMGSHSLFVFTHDSIGLGEDGPTHQPVEHLMMLRATPKLTDFRPADANETVACWKLAIERKSPSFFALSRQDLPILDAEKYGVMAGVAKGAYFLEKGGDKPAVVLVATGSEVSLVVDAAKALESEGVKARVVSMPSWKIFEEQADEYKASIFPDNVPKLAVEAGASLGWWKYVGKDGGVIGVDKFGASAPGKINFEHYGFTVENVVAQAKKIIAKAGKR
jgi:transketolase